MQSLIAGIPVPSSEMCKDALELARKSLETPIFNHSLRAYFFSALISRSRGASVDQELLFVANVLHDLGLSSVYQSTDKRFEVDGANAACEVLARHGRSEREQELVWDAIALHTSGAIAKWKPPLVALSNAGIVTDVHGTYLEGLATADITAVLNALSRDGFTESFLLAVANIARDKPAATMYSFAADVGSRLVPGFHLPNFVDEFVSARPFEVYENAMHEQTTPPR